MASLLQGLKNFKANLGTAASEMQHIANQLQGSGADEKKFLDAVTEGRCQVAANLLTGNPNVIYARTKEWHNAWHIAAAAGNISMLEVLHLHGRGATRKPLPGEPPHYAARTRDKKETPLMLAAANDHLTAVHYLLGVGANPVESDKYGNTIVHYAALKGQVKMLAILLAADEGQGAELLGPIDRSKRLVEKRNEAGLQPLHFAVWGGFKAAVQTVLQYRPDLTAKSTSDSMAQVTCNGGSTPLHVAALKNDTALVDLLLKTYVEWTNDGLGPRLDPRLVKDNYGFTPSTLATDLKRETVVPLLDPAKELEGLDITAAAAAAAGVSYNRQATLRRSVSRRGTESGVVGSLARVPEDSSEADGFAQLAAGGGRRRLDASLNDGRPREPVPLLVPPPSRAGKSVAAAMALGGAAWRGAQSANVSGSSTPMSYTSPFKPYNKAQSVRVSHGGAPWGAYGQVGGSRNWMQQPAPFLINLGSLGGGLPDDGTRGNEDGMITSRSSSAAVNAAVHKAAQAAALAQAAATVAAAAAQAAAELIEHEVSGGGGVSDVPAYAGSLQQEPSLNEALPHRSSTALRTSQSLAGAMSLAQAEQILHDLTQSLSRSLSRASSVRNMSSLGGQQHQQHPHHDTVSQQAAGDDGHAGADVSAQSEGVTFLSHAAPAAASPFSGDASKHVEQAVTEPSLVVGREEAVPDINVAHQDDEAITKLELIQDGQDENAAVSDSVTQVDDVSVTASDEDAPLLGTPKGAEFDDVGNDSEFVSPPTETEAETSDGHMDNISTPCEEQASAADGNEQLGNNSEEAGNNTACEIRTDSQQYFVSPEECVSTEQHQQGKDHEQDEETGVSMDGAAGNAPPEQGVDEVVSRLQDEQVCVSTEGEVEQASASERIIMDDSRADTPCYPILAASETTNDDESSVNEAVTAADAQQDDMLQQEQPYIQGLEEGPQEDEVAHQERQTLSQTMPAVEGMSSSNIAGTLTSAADDNSKDSPYSIRSTCESLCFQMPLPPERQPVLEPGRSAHGRLSRHDDPGMTGLQEGDEEACREGDGADASDFGWHVPPDIHGGASSISKAVALTDSNHNLEQGQEAGNHPTPSVGVDPSSSPSEGDAAEESSYATAEGAAETESIDAQDSAEATASIAAGAVTAAVAVATVRGVPVHRRQTSNSNLPPSPQYASSTLGGNASATLREGLEPIHPAEAAAAAERGMVKTGSFTVVRRFFQAKSASPGPGSDVSVSSSTHQVVFPTTPSHHRTRSSVDGEVDPGVTGPQEAGVAACESIGANPDVDAAENVQTVEESSGNADGVRVDDSAATQPCVDHQPEQETQGLTSPGHETSELQQAQQCVVEQYQQLSEGLETATAGGQDAPVGDDDGDGLDVNVPAAASHPDSDSPAKAAPTPDSRVDADEEHATPESRGKLASQAGASPELTPPFALLGGGAMIYASSRHSSSAQQQLDFTSVNSSQEYTHVARTRSSQLDQQQHNHRYGDDSEDEDDGRQVNGGNHHERARTEGDDGSSVPGSTPVKTDPGQESTMLDSPPFNTHHSMTQQDATSCSMAQSHHDADGPDGALMKGYRQYHVNSLMHDTVGASPEKDSQEQGVDEADHSGNANGDVHHDHGDGQDSSDEDISPHYPLRAMGDVLAAHTKCMEMDGGNTASDLPYDAGKKDMHTRYSVTPSAVSSEIEALLPSADDADMQHAHINGHTQAVVGSIIEEHVASVKDATEAAAIQVTANSTASSAMEPITPAQQDNEGVLSTRNSAHSTQSTDDEWSITGLPPLKYVCPITNQVMVNAVIAADGRAYERDALRMWFSLGNIWFPGRGLRIYSYQTTPATELIDKIAAWKRKHGLA